MFSFCGDQTIFASDPPENCHLTVKKLAKTWLFFNCQKFPFFSKKLPMAILLKNDNFCQFFWKNVKFLAIFWQSNGNFPEGHLGSHQSWESLHWSRSYLKTKQKQSDRNEAQEMRRRNILQMYKKLYTINKSFKWIFGYNCLFSIVNLCVVFREIKIKVQELRKVR